MCVLTVKSPFFLIPPPFNAITILLYPLHLWTLGNFHISIAGTVADYILG